GKDPPRPPHGDRGLPAPTPRRERVLEDELGKALGRDVVEDEQLSRTRNGDVGVGRREEERVELRARQASAHADHLAERAAVVGGGAPGPGGAPLDDRPRDRPRPGGFSPPPAPPPPARP